jgi:hypothetical protein
MEKRTKAETEKLYRGLLAELDASGLTQREFAAKRNVPAGTLSFWKHELKKRDAAAKARKSKKRPSKPKFVPVSVVDAAKPVEPVAKATEGYEIVLGPDRVLRLPAGFDEGRVAALVRAVASC